MRRLPALRGRLPHGTFATVLDCYFATLFE